MFLDASAIVAIINEERDANELVHRLGTARDSLYISPLVRFEAVMAVARVSADARSMPMAPEILADARLVVNTMIDQLGAVEISLSPEIGTSAIEAAMTYGKIVRHAAKLNFGDCFAYACAKSLGVPLLYKGDDFAKTDLA